MAKMEMQNCEAVLLEEIADEDMSESDVALSYALALKSDFIDWRKVNLAIIQRWSVAGLARIKNLAWKAGQ